MAAFPRIPGYRITRLLGQGGMSNVYLARDAKLDRDVAVKVLFDSLSEDRRTTSRFLHEAKTAARLQHSNIIHIYGVGHHRRHYYMVMELLHGSLKPMIEDSGVRPLFPEPGLSIVSEIALALDYAHQQGVIHRDIKPDNIMFRADGTPVLVDFGISRCLYSNTRLTRTGMSIGTPHYMSPEQIRGRGVDGRSDLYSLGVVWYEMLTGKVPYTATEAIAVAMKHIREPVPDLPESWAFYHSLVHSLMAKDPADRPPNGRMLNRMINELRERLAEREPGSGTLSPKETATRSIRSSAPDLTVTALRPLRHRFRRFGIILTLAALALTGSVPRRTGPSTPVQDNPGAVPPHPVKTGPDPGPAAIPAAEPGTERVRSERMRALMEETRFPEARRFTAKEDKGTASSLSAVLKSRYDTILRGMLAHRRLRLRTRPMDVSEAVARSRVRHLGFYDKTWNTAGGFPNRFQSRRIHGQPVVLDLATGLMWMQGASEKHCRFSETASWLEGFNRRRYAGFSNWRLPTIEEAATLLDRERSAAGFHMGPEFSSDATRIWTADHFPPSGHWYVNLRRGSISWNMLGLNRCHIRPVRSVYVGIR